MSLAHNINLNWTSMFQHSCLSSPTHIRMPRRSITLISIKSQLSISDGVRKDVRSSVPCLLTQVGLVGHPPLQWLQLPTLCTIILKCHVTKQQATHSNSTQSLSQKEGIWYPHPYAPEWGRVAGQMLANIKGFWMEPKFIFHPWSLLLLLSENYSFTTSITMKFTDSSMYSQHRPISTLLGVWCAGAPQCRSLQKHGTILPTVPLALPKMLMVMVRKPTLGLPLSRLESSLWCILCPASIGL